jgi:hypothetical protein
MFQLRKNVLIFIIFMDIKSIKKALYYSMLVFMMAIVGMSNADAAEDQATLDHAEERAKEVFDGLKQWGGVLLDSSGITSKGKDLCNKMEANFPKVMINELFYKTTGKVIEEEFRKGNTGAADLMAYWNGLLNEPNPYDFEKTWKNYFQKKLGWVNSYRCIRHGNDMNDAIYQTAVFMQSVGYPNWTENFNNMLKGMKKH